MSTRTLEKLTSQSVELDLSPETFGELRRSDDIVEDVETLRARMDEDGYLFLPGYLQRSQVLEARLEMLERLSAEGVLHPDFPLEEGVLSPDAHFQFRPDLALDNAPLQRLLYDGAMMRFWQGFLGEAVRHFDFTWVRAVSPGRGTPAHCDIVYMGRGTQELYTAWTPLGDTTLEMGGLMMLEGSHKHQKLRENYGRKDVDAFCTNKIDDVRANNGGANGSVRTRDGGMLSHEVSKLRRALGGRWLTNPFQMGDLLVFSVHTVHASLDNQSDKIRLSSDSRYQRASEPADERWIGENPIGHGPNAKRGLIC